MTPEPEPEPEPQIYRSIDKDPSFIYHRSWDQRVAPVAASLALLGVLVAIGVLVVYLTRIANSISTVANVLIVTAGVLIGLPLLYGVIFNVLCRILDNKDFRLVMKGFDPPRSVSLGINDNLGVWAVSVDGDTPIILDQIGADPGVLMVEMRNTCMLSPRQRRARPFQIAQDAAWQEVAGGPVSSTGDALAIMGQALDDYSASDAAV